MISPTPPLRSTPSPAVSQALAILRLLGNAAAPMRVTAIARAAGLSPSSAFNLVKTLTEEGMIEFDVASKTYRLGFGAVELSRMALRADAIVQAARPALQHLADRHDAAIGLWRATGPDRLTLIALTESESATRIHMASGQRQPRGAGATGRALLAANAASRDELRAVFDLVRWQQPVLFDDYVQQVATARSLGYARDDGWINAGILTVASAIADPDGSARYCVSASMFAGRQDAPGIGSEVAAAAAAIARQVYGPGLDARR